MACVYKEHEVKNCIVAMTPAKWSLYWVITWKSFFGRGIDFWKGREE